MPTIEEIRAEWKTLRSALGNLICYIDGKTEQLQDLQHSWQEGYECGHKDGIKVGLDEAATDSETRFSDAYNCGLETAWDIARRITAEETEENFYDMFAVDYIGNIFAYYSAEEAIQKVKEYDARKADTNNLKFLDFLYNVIQPNEMEQYMAMYHASGIPTCGEEGNE